jgi:TPP-dependent pyruvate/acetoin dehydrogenase alpha subunit
MFDAELYRDRSEVDTWKQRDPIRLLTDRLADAGMLDAAARAGFDADVEAEMSRAVAFAEAGTWEPVDHLTRDVYTPPAS